MDLGSSINVMPYAIFEELKFGDLKRTSITIQLADCLIKYSQGIIEGMVLNVHEFLLLGCFVVMELERVSLG